MSMKIIKWAGFALTAFAINTAVAQDATNRRPELSPEQRADKITAHFKEELKLSDDQAAKVKAIFLEQENNRQKDMEKKKAIHDQMQKTLEGVLTPDQVTKYRQMQADRKENGKNHGHHDKRPMPDDSNPPQPMEDK